MRHLRTRGFTLIEILIVMLIIGVMFSMIILTGKVSRAEELKLKDVAYKVYSAFLLVQDQAKLQNRSYAVIVSNDQYTLYRLEQRNNQALEWLPVSQPKNFSSIKFPNGINNHFLEKFDARLLPRMNVVPDIIFYNDGTVTPFKLSFYIEKPRRVSIHIIGNKDGDIDITALEKSQSK